MARSNSFIAAVTELDRLPVSVGVLELDGTIVRVNPAGTEMLGRPVEEIIGRKAWEFAPGAEHIWDEVIATARRVGVFRGEIAVATTQGARNVRYSAALRVHEGETVVVVLAIELATEPDNVRLLDLESKQRLEALGLVAGGIAHDFNNQLVSVLAEASAAREDAMLGDAGRDSLRRIEAAAHRMAQLTRQLLAYAGRGRFVTEVIDPDELLQQTHEQLTRSVRPDAELLITPNAGVIAVEADRGLLRQVIVNLVANASDALPAQGGRVTVVSRAVGRPDGRTWWRLEVGDNGAGMDPRTAARIFDPFFTTKADRHGLGLSAVHGIVRRLGGEVDVDSKVGEGTLFTVRLPVVVGAEPQRKRSTSKQPSVATLRGQRILVADDEPSVRNTVRRLLERRGATVVLAADGKDAEMKLLEGTYQLVLLDVMMPQRSGYELLPFARELQPNAKVMLMSGYTEDKRGTGGEEEPDAFLEKPFTAKALDRAIDELLDRR